VKWEDYKGSIIEGLHSFEFNDQIIGVLKDSVKNNQKIFVAGNGGSAAIAMHYVCDLSKGANKDWLNNSSRFKAINLSNNIGYMTAVSNDEGYDEIFKQQLINLASKEDILVLISSSGNSPNIVKAAEFAKEKGMIVIGVCGFQGGKLKELSDHFAHAKVDSYEVCEDIHTIFGHFLACCLREKE
tara:strand:- start:362 stop:916 length:555 start_codon:yes stop_codon:yes gene_type:complete